jgi:hypothetical protein
LMALTVTILVDSLGGGVLGKRCRRFAFTGGDGGEWDGGDGKGCNMVRLLASFSFRVVVLIAVVNVVSFDSCWEVLLVERKILEDFAGGWSCCVSFLLVWFFDSDDGDDDVIGVVAFPTVDDDAVDGASVVVKGGEGLEWIEEGEGMLEHILQNQSPKEG